MMKIRNILNLVSRRFGDGVQASKDDLENLSHLLRKNRTYYDTFLSFYKKGYSYKEIEDLFVKVRDYRPLLRNNNIDVLKHTTYASLSTTVDRVIKANEDDKFVSSLFSNKALELKTPRVVEKIIELKNKGYTAEELRMLLFRRISSYRSESEFWADIKNLTIKNDFKFRIHIISFFLRIRRKKIGNFLILDFNQNFWKFAFFVSLRWCIKTKSKFYEYVTGGNRQLIIFDFSRRMSDPFYKVGVTIDRYGGITHAHNKVNDALYRPELATYQKLIIFEYLKNGDIGYDNISTKILLDIGEHDIAYQRILKSSRLSEVEMFFNMVNSDYRIRDFDMLYAFINSSKNKSRFPTWTSKQNYFDKYCDFNWRDLSSILFHTMKSDRVDFIKAMFYGGRFDMLLNEYGKDIKETDFTFFRFDHRSVVTFYDYLKSEGYVKSAVVNQKYLYNISKYFVFDDLKRITFLSKNIGILKGFHEMYQNLKVKSVGTTKDYRVIMASIFLDSPASIEPYLTSEIVDESIYVFCARYEKNSIYYEDVENVIKYYDNERLKRLLTFLKEIPKKESKEGVSKGSGMRKSTIEWITKVLEDMNKPIETSTKEGETKEVYGVSIDSFKKGLESKHAKKAPKVSSGTKTTKSIPGSMQPRRYR